MLTVIFSLQPGCSDEESPLLDETVGRPDKPSGRSVCAPAETIVLTTGGAASSLGHVIQYRFDLDSAGDHDYTGWSDADTVAVSWPDTGLYAVTAQSRCAQHTEVVSPWSQDKPVYVGTTGPEPPVIYFATHIDGVSRPYTPSEVPQDTVGVMKPFWISYHGRSMYGGITAYKFFPLTAGVTIPGQGMWYTDTADTMRTLANAGPQVLPDGVFRIAAQCRDELGKESVVDAGMNDPGVCRVVVNFDPDTRINRVVSSYTLEDGVHQREIDFTDDIPDTVSYDSWLRLDYEGWEDPRDDVICSPGEPNRCVAFQVFYIKDSARIGGAQEFSLWQPRGDLHDTDPSSSADSNTFSIGSLEYELFVRSVDERGRPDGTPPSVDIVGNFDPVLDSLAVEDHLGNRVDLSGAGEMTWNFWKGEGWPYQCECDTVAAPQAFCDSVVDCGGRQFSNSDGSFDFYKSWSVRIRAWGHDHPMDPRGSGVKSWRYMVENSQGQILNLGKSFAGFFDGAQIDVLDDNSIRWRVYYPGPFATNPDPNGDTVFASLPIWLDEDLTFYLMGRDTRTIKEDYEQVIFVNGQKSIINVFPDASLGRWTEERVFTFRIHLVR